MSRAINWEQIKGGRPFFGAYDGKELQEGRTVQSLGPWAISIAVVFKHTIAAYKAQVASLHCEIKLPVHVNFSPAV